MRPSSCAPTRRQRGFMLLEVLLVLVVILILTGGYFGGFGRNSNPSQGLAKHSIDKSKDIVCQTNRLQLSTSIQMWRINNPTAPVTAAGLAAAQVNVPRCPEGVEYVIAPDGAIYCPKHNPPPPDLVLEAPSAEATPPPGMPPAAPDMPPGMPPPGGFRN